MKLENKAEKITSQRPASFPRSRRRCWLFGLFLGVALCLVTSRPSHAVWLPGFGLGGLYQPNLATGSSTGGTILQLDVGYMWEWERFALILSVPVETDFGTRVGVGPQLRFEIYRYFRLLLAPMVDIPFQQPYSIFFVRSGFEAGYRTYGIQAKKDDPTPIRAGFYLFAHFDARVPMPGQPTGQEFRLSGGLRIEIGL